MTTKEEVLRRVRPRASRQRKIICAFKDAEEALTPAEIQSRTGLGEMNVRTALTPMVEAQLLHKTRTGVYKLGPDPEAAHIGEHPEKRYHKALRTVDAHSPKAQSSSRFVLTIPVFKPMDTNGAGPRETVVQDVREMERRFGSDARVVRRRYMMGDAMRGSIMPGAEVDCIPVEDYQGPGLYYMHLDGRPLIARLQPVGGGGWLIKYDSAEYEDEMLLPDEKGAFRSRLTGMPVTLRVHERVGAYRVIS